MVTNIAIIQTWWRQLIPNSRIVGANRLGITAGIVAIVRSERQDSSTQADMGIDEIMAVAAQPEQREGSGQVDMDTNPGIEAEEQHQCRHDNGHAP